MLAENPQKIEIETLLTDLRADSSANIKFNKIKSFFENKDLREISVENFINIIQTAQLPDMLRPVLFNSYFLSEASNSIDKNDFIKILNEASFDDSVYNKSFKASAVSFFIRSFRSTGINSDDILEIIEKTNIKYEEKKALIISAFIKSDKSTGMTIDDMFEITNRAGIVNQEAKASIISSFIESDKSTGITSDDAIKIIEKGGISYDNIKTRILGDFFLKQCSSGSLPSVDNFINIIKKTNLQDRADLICSIYANAFQIKDLPSQTRIENFTRIAKTLHPNEASQCDFIKVSINSNFINQENVKYLKPFIEGLQDNGLALDITETLVRKRILTNEKDILSLVKNKSKKQYALLTEILKNPTLDICITDQGIEALKATFGDDLTVDGNPITIGDLISYYDIKDQNSELSLMLKPEFKQQLRDNFAPSSKVLLCNPQELEKLNQLLNEEGVDFDFKNHFIENAKLCDYLKEKVEPIVEFDSSKIYQINFANFDFEIKFEEGDTDEQKASKLKSLERDKKTLNDLFNEILKEEDPNPEKIEEFFNGLLKKALPLEENRAIKLEDLKAFFQNNKNEIAHCFCNENLEKKDFESLFSTLNDGCFANIGTQFKTMFYGVMIKDESSQVLYALANPKIFSHITNNHGSDIMTVDLNPMDNDVIRSYHLSPMVFFNNLLQESILNNQKSWKIIQEKLGDDEGIELSSKISEEVEGNNDKINIKAKEIASYLIMKEFVGEDKMRDLESKNPELKALKDYVFIQSRPNSPQPISAQLTQSQETANQERRS